MTTIRVAIVDVYAMRGAGDVLQVLLLRRAAGRRSTGSWEAVHGHIEPEETPVDAARRELMEETGRVPERLYNLSRVEQFYLHRTDEVALIPVFVAFLDSTDEVTIGPEHDASRWLSPSDAMRECAWPREARAIEDAVRLFRTGDAGAVEDVLRVS